ncbi:MAG TPA: ABC transporter permease subunit [Micromonosporaceae bacterium]|nr:ABC transporter permease subunit [Micromonosporaceae bacterium]
MADTLSTELEPRDETADRGGAGSARPRRGLARRFNLDWVGLVPFFAYVLIFFLVPIGFILYNAFIKRTTSASTVRNPVTQQFVHTTTTSFGGANISASLQGIYRTSLINTLKLSAIVAIIGAVLGILLAYAVVNSRSELLKQIVTSASAVTANFGGIPLAFLFIATVGNAGVVTTFLNDHFGFSLAGDMHFQLATISGIALVYMYFLVPLMVLVMTPALEGLKPQWAEAAENLGANRWHYWRYVAGPVLLPNFLGSVLLLFCSSFSAYATANALAGQSFPLVPTQIASVLSGNVLSGQENLGAALALDMIVVVLPLTVIYQLLQRRTSRWLS